MKVAYDGQIFCSQRVGGISRYFAELVAAFCSDPSLDVDIDLDFRFCRNDYLLARQRTPPLRGPRADSRLDRNQICRWGNRLLPRRRPSRDTVAHLTFYSGHSADRYRSNPIVTTVYDMIPEMLPGRVRGSPHAAKLEIASRSNAVICISESVRNDYLRISGLPGDNVFVTHLGCHPQPLASAAHSTRERRVLFVGGRGGYKRFDHLIGSLSELADVDPFEVLCVGGGPFREPEQLAIDRLPPNISMRQAALSDELLQQAYLSSAAYVSTSEAEGFGLPALEAMAAGCPTVLTDNPVYRELWSGLDGMIPQGDSSALADALRSVLGLSVDELSERGLRGWRASSAFTWHRTAQETRSAYAYALSHQ